LAWYGKTKSTHSPIKRNALQHKISTQKTKTRFSLTLVVSYDIQPGNREGLLWFWCFINLTFTYLVRHVPTYSPGTHMGQLTESNNNQSANCSVDNIIKNLQTVHSQHSPWS